MSKIKVMSIFGTRPEAIKMAPVIMKMRERPEFEPITVVTGQHREMLDQVLKIFKIVPDFDLNIMSESQTLSRITKRVMMGLDPIIEKCKPNIILVHGDTTTTFASGLSAFYHQVAVGHVEAGLRTWDKYSPYPEEMNRQMTDVLSDLYFAPTVTSKANLIKENHDVEKIFVTGNTAIDALEQTVNDNYHHEILDSIKENNRIILVTMHRRENQGEPMKKVFKAIKDVVDTYSDVEVVFPVHLNPKIQKLAKNTFGTDQKIHLTDPLDVIDFHNIAARSYFIMTDSGGVQEEAPSIGKPVLVLRNTTERPEGIRAGTLKLVGTNPDVVSKMMFELLDNKKVYDKMANAKNPYGDGHAATRILNAIVEWNNKNNE